MNSLLGPTRFGACLLSLTLVFGLLSGCGSDPHGDPPNADGGSAGSTGEGGTGNNGGGGFGEESVACTPTVEIASNSRSFIITDAEILAKFRLERVLKQLIDTTGNTSSALTPLSLLQRFFDTENTTSGGAFTDVVHCDSMNLAFLAAPPTHCPRAEGALATNPNLLTDGDPNSFVPVAIVNRFDLTRTSGIGCGEYRIVYAKSSGKTNPDDRIFIIIESFLTNPNFPDVMACKPVADLWASLDKETDVQKVSDKVENFFFTGLSGFGPVVHADNCGEKGPDDDGSYGGSRGQIRIGHKMQVPWEWREFHLKRDDMPGTSAPLNVAPVTVKNNPIPEYFDIAATPGYDFFRQEFLMSSVQSLAATELHGIRMNAPGKSNMGQSAFEGAAASNYAAQGAKNPGNDFATQIDSQLSANQMGTSCPPDDPLTGKNILQRASVQTCAGCHAPQQFLEPGNSLGCGLTWPDSLGEVHIDENGQLSKALTDVFLPRRAEVLSKFVGGCSMAAINHVLQPADSGDMGGIPK